jgi:hypothetical protein
MEKKLKIIFNDNNEIEFDNYCIDRYNQSVDIMFENPESADDIIEYILSCDYSKFDFIANYSNKVRQHRFINYMLFYTNIKYTEYGPMLNVVFIKKGRGRR